MDESLKKLLTHRPTLHALIQQAGSMPLTEYLESLCSRATKPTNSIIATVQKTILQTGLPPLETSILELPLIHTADHMGILNHAFFWTAKAVTRNSPTIVLATSNISPTNSSYPRGIFWHNTHNKRVQASFIPHAYRRYALFAIPALTRVDFERWISNIDTHSEIRDILSRAINQKSLYETQWLSEQLTIMNHIWWRELFGTNTLYYLDLESIVTTQLITDSVNIHSAFHTLCDDANLQQQYLKYFNGVQGAHNHAMDTGSDFFWLLDPNTKRRLQLRLIDGHLVHGTTKIPFRSDELLKLLLQRRIMPTLALSYCTLAFEHNMTLTGGFSQIEYLQEMQRAWNLCFQSKFNPPTSLFAGELCVMQTNDTPQTLCDIANNFNTQEERIKRVDTALRHHTLEDAVREIAPLLLEIIEKKER